MFGACEPGELDRVDGDPVVGDLDHRMDRRDEVTDVAHVRRTDDGSPESDRIADLTTEVDALPALTRQVKEVQASQDPAAAEALVEEAERIQKDIRKAEEGFDEAIGKVERFVNRYPGLADCR